MEKRVFLPLISDVLLMYPGEDRGTRSAIVFLLKPVFQLCLTDEQSEHIWLFVYKGHLIIFNEQC